MVLIPQPFEDPLGRVPLLTGRLFIVFENLMNDRQERFERRFSARSLLSIPWWLRVRKNLLQRVPTQFILAAGRSLAQLLGQHTAADFGPKLHVSVHSCTSL